MRKTKEQNSKYQTPKTNNGITLIALVITIIVMLILVAVTISMAVNGGLFTKAADAGQKTNEAVIAEQELGTGRIKIGNTWYDSLQDYKNNNPSDNQGEQENPETPGDDENIQITISGLSEVDVKNTITLTAESENASFDASKIEWDWTSSNPQVATIENGVVTGVDANTDEGKVTIIVKYNGKEVGSKEITVNPVLVDCPVCKTRVIDDMYNGYCTECQTEKWNEFTNNAVIIGRNGNYSNFLAMGQDYAVMKVIIVHKACCGCTNGSPVSCNYCNEKGQLYDMGSCYKRVEQEQAI